MHRPLLIAAALMLTACETPRERCIDNATKDITAIDAEIADVELSLARGYRIADSAIDTVGVRFCNGSGNVTFCLGGEKDIEGRRIPIDRATERARLASLERQRASTLARMDREIAACETL